LYVAAFTSLIVVADRVMRARVIARERQQSLLREAQLRAEKAAAEAKVLQAENERNKNVQLLSEIGKDLTSSLDVDTIFAKLHDHVKPLMDASIFAVGIYHKQREEIEYRFVATNGERKPSFSLPAKNNPSIPAWCLDNRKAAVLNDVGKDCSQYGNSAGNCPGDGASPSKPASLIYLPLMMQDRPIGVISVQSAVPNAYSDYHVDLLENLASYTAIALDNADAYHRLKSAQEQLVVQEKLASLGALTAGIAHEIKNPLNFVNNFADLSVELMEELREEVEKLRNGEAPDVDNMEDLLEDLTGNAKKINEHGKRADGIVKSMLLHSRGQAGERQITDINAMVEEYLNLSYHGMRAQDSTFNATIERHFAADLGKIDAIPQDLSRVFLNILNNACYAVNERLKKQGAGYSPKLVVRTVNLGDEIEVRIRDNGLGIPPEVRDKIFNPFFTTKPTGQGTGLGLSISHDIVVQEHQGQLEVETEAGQFTEFIVRLPRHWREA
jgi:signal transduction histidine kinase